MLLLCLFSDHAGFDPRMQLVFGTEEGIASAYLSKGVVVEGAAVVLALRRALRPALLDVRHEADVGVSKGQVGAGAVNVLAVGRDCLGVTDINPMSKMD